MLRCLDFFLLFSVCVLILSLKASRCVKTHFCKASLYAGIAFSNYSALHDKLEMRLLIPLGSCLIMLGG